ncbi:MAG TPA: sensor domain-containing diguanylate cyclase [Capsulimonadaceae bacterium]
MTNAREKQKSRGRARPVDARSKTATRAERRMWIAAGVASVALPVYAVFVEPRVVTWPLNGHGGIIVFLFAFLALISCLLPVTAPRLAQRARLTPITALSALLIMPPALATVPFIIAGFLAIVVQEEASVKRRNLSHFSLIVTAQILTGALLIKTEILPVNGSMSLVQSLIAGMSGLMLFGGLFLGGLLLQRRNEHGWGVRRDDDHGWQVAWTNEVYVYFAASPFAAILSFTLLRDGGVYGAATAVVITCILGLFAKFVIERKMLRRQVKAMEKLTECASIGRTPNAARLVEEFVERTRTLVLFDRARVWIYNDVDTALQCVSDYPPRRSSSHIGEIRRMGEELVGRVAARRTAMLVPDIRRDARHTLYNAPERQKLQMGPISQMVLPLVANNETMGVVEFERRQWNAFATSDRDRIQCLATLVAMGLANIRRHEDVVQMAVTDGLTGLYNKRHIMSILQDEVGRSERYGHTLSVLMMDLDSFKSYNDTYGHLQGDNLLSQLAAIIQDSIRSSDHAGRYGGEEFIVIMPETSKEASRMTAERIRQRIEAAQFPGRARGPEEAEDEDDHDGDGVEGETWVRKTISIGVANYPRDAQDSRVLVGMADDALYHAKRSGRNRVIGAGEFKRIDVPAVAAEPG